jgi:histidinol-phosphate aminotransferase
VASAAPIDARSVRDTADGNVNAVLESGCQFPNQRGSTICAAHRSRKIASMTTPSTSIGPTPRPGIMDIAIYVPGEAKLPSGVVPIKLSSNENPLGASPKARAAYEAAAKDLERYPDGGSTALRQAIASVYGLDADRIVCGAGSDELLGLLGRCYLGPGDEALYSQYGFLMYKIVTQACGAIPVVAPEQGYKTDVAALLARVTPRTRMVFLANPNNPTGTYIPISEVRRLHAGLPRSAILVLDAAYCEYVRKNDYEAGIELAGASDNVVMTRTFSKIHGLAALRLGWLYGPRAIVDVMNRVRGPFNVSAPAIAAGVASINDKAFIETAVQHNATWLEKLSTEIAKLGLVVTPSVGNFILVHFPADARLNAGAADAFLKSRGIIVRAMKGYGMPSALRFTIGTDDENAVVLKTLADFVRQHSV